MKKLAILITAAIFAGMIFASCGTTKGTVQGHSAVTDGEVPVEEVTAK